RTCSARKPPPAKSCGEKSGTTAAGAVRADGIPAGGRTGAIDRAGSATTVDRGDLRHSAEVRAARRTVVRTARPGTARRGATDGTGRDATTDRVRTTDRTVTADPGSRRVRNPFRSKAGGCG